jgi:oxygen-independent coproporphyrinogen-3 oxidase
MGGAGQLLRLDGENFVVPDESRPLIRTVAAKFDRYLGNGTGRHSLAV